MKGWQFNNACYVESSDQKDDLVSFRNFCTKAYRICFLVACHNFKSPSSLEAKTWYKT